MSMPTLPSGGGEAMRNPREREMPTKNKIIQYIYRVNLTLVSIPTFVPKIVEAKREELNLMSHFHETLPNQTHTAEQYRII